MNKEVIDYKSAYENVLIANNMLRKENKELHNKIDKAIEYIEEACWYPDCNNYSNMTDSEVKELLEILEG